MKHCQLKKSLDPTAHALPNSARCLIDFLLSCLTAPISHCHAVSLSGYWHCLIIYCPTASLSHYTMHCPTISPPILHCPTAALPPAAVSLYHHPLPNSWPGPRCLTARLPHCPTVILHHCPHCPTVSLYLMLTTPLPYCLTVSLTPLPCYAFVLLYHLAPSPTLPSKIRP